jgi:hypothetical protein
MNADFLHDYRQSPSPEFARALYARLAEEKPGPLAGKLTFRNAALALALLVLFVACVRVLTRPYYDQIGEIWVDVKPHEVIPEQPEIVSADDLPGPLPEYTLADIEEAFDGAVKVPAWLPDGYAFDSVTSMTDLGTQQWAFISWQGSSSDRHITLVARCMRAWMGDHYVVGPVYTWSVGPGSYREVEVNGQPAVAVRGDWARNDVDLEGDFPTEVPWDRNVGIQLYWVDGEWFYLLMASPDLSFDDLIRMAESAR